MTAVVWPLSRPLSAPVNLSGVIHRPGDCGALCELLSASAASQGAAR